jgi:NADH-quinone oxidoreductase subunit L
MLILAVPAMLAGFCNLPFDGYGSLGHLLEGALPEEVAESLHHGEFRLWIAAASTLLALAGIALAYAIYEMKAISAESLQRAFGPVHTLVSRKYYMDDLYEQVVVKNALYNGVCYAAAWFDANIVDGVVNGSATVTRRAGDGLRWVQSGSVQAYGTVGFAGLIIGSAVMLVLVER